MGPDHTTVLQLGERLECARALFDRAQILLADAWQVDDRSDTLLQLVFERAGDHATQPVGRATPLFGRITTERQQWEACT
jgi:hypothetical protein